MIMMVMIKSDQTYHLKHCLGLLGPAETDFLVVSMVACLQAQRLAFQLAQWQNHNHDYNYDYTSLKSLNEFYSLVAFRFSPVGTMMTLKALIDEGQDEQDVGEDIKRHGG